MDAADLADIFQAFGSVRMRRMFGGHGIYRDDVMFGLEIDGALFLKTDDESRPQFEAAGARPLTYARQDGRTVVMSFWSLPDEALDDPAATARWAGMAWTTALRAHRAKAARLRDKAAPRTPGPAPRKRQAATRKK